MKQSKGVDRANDIYEGLTKRFVESVLENKNPFRQAFERLGGFARNAVSGRAYNGMNQLLLGLGQCDYESPFYLTYKQAKEAGGTVKKGEKGHKVTFWKLIDPKDPANPKKRIPFLKVYTVFNIAQCEGLELELPEVPRFETVPIDEVEALVSAMPHAPEIRCQDGYARACYAPSTDLVKMPVPAQFRDAESYYHVLFHELSHATGHKSRLSRKGITHEGVTLAGFGTETYSREELIAEMSASFCSARLGLFSEETEQMTVAYLRAWLKPLQDDVKAIAQAAGQAMKACQWIFGELEEEPKQA